MKTRISAFVKFSFLLLALSLPARLSAAVMDWDAARDLRSNELLGSPQESMNPNPSVTNWSYGYRLESDLATTDLTLFNSSQHVHDGANSPYLQGWYRGSPADGPSIHANIGVDPVVVSFCCGPLQPINTNDLAVWPSNDGYAAVVRWVAPVTANYDISAYWRKTDLNSDGGCLSAVVVNGTVVYNQVWFNADTPGYTNTVAINAGEVVDFMLGPDGGYSFDGSKFNAKIVMQSLGALPAVNSVSASAGVSPVRSNNPWTFTATYSTLVSDLRLRVQSTLTPNVEGSWTDLPGNPYMTHVGSDWSLNTTDVPTGIRYFRVIAAAPYYTDGVSTAQGPFTVSEGITPFGDFSWQTTGPFQSNVPWIFTIVEYSAASGLHLRVQSTANTNDSNSWTDLPGNPFMSSSGAQWSLNTTNVPTGNQSFRVIASAPTYVDRISSVLGSFNIVPPLPPVRKTSSTSGNYNLLDIDEVQSPDEVFAIAVSTAVVNFGLPFNLDVVQLNAAISLAAEQYAQAIMPILPNQTVTVSALNAGANALVELKGTLIGPLSLITSDGAGLITSDGAGVVSQGGGNLTYDANTSSLITSDGAGLITSDGAGLITSDGAGAVAQGGGNIVTQAAGNTNAATGGKTQRTSSLTLQSTGPTQPAFTGLMTVNGDYNQFGGTLYLGVAGTNASAQGAQQFDQLVVNGTARLFGGNITVGLFDPDDQSNRVDVFLPPSGAVFDVLVATNITVNSSFKVRSPIWADGVFFRWSIVTRDDNKQVLRLLAAPCPPPLTLAQVGENVVISYPTNFVGYTFQSATTLSPANWSTFSTGTNLLNLNPADAHRYFRLIKP